MRDFVSSHSRIPARVGVPAEVDPPARIPEVVNIREEACRPPEEGYRPVAYLDWTSRGVGSFGTPLFVGQLDRPQLRMLTALETTTATVTSEASD
jgi:hypothetical protein